ncbi:MAG TPA: phosphoenolpyruvate--protein phosphotransferase [Steroidobacteraceae bacterium]|jgi:phosphoenolpyruvate-protein phosphotransferase|nr:phosphoenolpyruvate--protein phosphotransferase [Steroidobacteraceae bacterium]
MSARTPREEGAIILAAPLEGWSTSLDETPDAVFAGRMMGDGVAIDPTAGVLHAPCDGQIVAVAAAHHAVTLRTRGGCQILMHVGIDTVALAGAGFTVHAAQGARVRSGDRLLTFDLDMLARRAPSLLTPVLVTADSGFRIVRRTLDARVAVGDALIDIVPDAAVSPAAASVPASGPVQVKRVTVGFEHGIHARPAAVLAASLKDLAADVRVLVRGHEANARSTVALMTLGAQHGDEVEIRASGPDAALALNTLATALGTAHGTGSARAPRGGIASDAPHSAASVDAAPERRAPPGPGDVLPGVIASRGLALGRAVQLSPPEIEVAEDGAGVEEESAALDRARAAVRARLERRAGAGAEGAGVRAAAEIAAAHLELIDDPELLGAARLELSQGRSAGFAWRQAVRAAAAKLRALVDPRLRERVDDLLDLETQVLLALSGTGAAATSELPEHSIVIARELLPSQLVALDAARIAGLAMAAGGATSHVAIIAAAMGLPALVALGPRALSLADGTPLLLDAERGVLEIEPPVARLDAARATLASRRAQLAAEQAAAQRDCHLADGTRIEVFANVGSLAEAEAAVRNGAEGCGLLRTEFLFLDRQLPPDEAEQTAEYQRIAAALAGRPLTIRTLDAGGDKPIAYLAQPREENPALGLRGVRTSLAYPELLKDQLRAILAVHPPEQCRILLPMITDTADVAAVRALLDEICAERRIERTVELGVMIETPASAVLADQLAAVADFLSVGTNDLTQYTLAMDRGNAQLAGRLDALHPAVLRLIERAAAAAATHGRMVAVCGGLASDPLAAPILVGLGVTELSAVGAVIPRLKAGLSRCTLAECRALAQQALAQRDAAAVRILAEGAGRAPPETPA